MFDWLSTQYVHLLSLYRETLTNPYHCSLIDVLRVLIFSVFFLFLIKCVTQTIVLTRLKQKYSRYAYNHHPALLKLYQRAVKKVKLRRIPPLCSFGTEKPLVFTAGFLRPAIFMAPRVMEQLDKPELEALLVHELIHIKRRDNLLFWCTELLYLAITVTLMLILSLGFVLDSKGLNIEVSNTAFAVLFALGMIAAFKFFFWKRFVFLRELSCDDRCVEITKAPLILASALVNVWTFGHSLPAHRWSSSLAFAQSFFSFQPSLEARVRRLLNYRRPWFKLLLGKVVRILVVILIFSVAAFFWKFYVTYCSLISMN